MSYTLDELNEIAEILERLDEDEIDYLMLEARPKIITNKMLRKGAREMKRKERLARAMKMHKIKNLNPVIK